MRHTLTELIYRFRICEAINLLHKLTESEIDCKVQCRDISDTVTFVSIKVKIQYDLRHKSLLLNVEDIIYLQINQKYNTLVHWVFNVSVKFLKQWIDSIQITEKIERNIYRFNIFSHWRIYPVILIIQLESADTADLWKHSTLTDSSAVSVTEDTDNWRFYKIKKLVDHRERIYSDKTIKKYLIRWKKYSAIYNKWYNKDLFTDADNLIAVYNAEYITILIQKKDCFRKIYKTVFRKFIKIF